MAVKISRLEIENVKRVRAVTLEPDANGLTVIGGRNGQGKTSVLDAIAWALGGNRFRPTDAQFDGSVLPPEIKIRLSNGLIVERKGKNSALTVTDPQGVKAGQTLLDSFVSALALDLPRFMAASDAEKADTLLRVIGVGDQLSALERAEKAAYNERLTVGRIADQKTKYAKEQPYYADTPDAPVSAAELIRRQQDILAHNAENARKRLKREQIASALEGHRRETARLEQALTEARTREKQLESDLAIAEDDTRDLADQSTEALEHDIEAIDEINRRVRANLDKEKAEQDAAEYRRQYNLLSEQISALREQKRALLDGADLPLPGLTVENGALRYRGKAWDCMSGSEQLRAATAIVRRLNPECGFVLMDRLEQMDAATLRDFGEWLTNEGLQAIATRVSEGSECTIIIEDGRAVGAENAPARKAWKAGEF